MRASGLRLHHAGFMFPLALAAIVGTSGAQEPRKATPAQSLEALKRVGKNASLTILPVGLGGQPMEPVAEVVGLFLERAGMPNLEIGAAPFRPPADADVSKSAAALAVFIKGSPITTDYALYAEFRMSPAREVEEVRGVVVSKQGEVVWQDRQTPQDADFKRIHPAEPMQCAILLVERLRPVLGLDDPMREDAPKGKLAERWAKKTGVPSEAEMAALTPRQEALKKAAPKARLVVFPVLINDQVSAPDATELVKAINDARLVQATAAAEKPRLEIKGAMNEQKMLWDLARSFQDYVKANKPDADYVLYAQYAVGNGGVGFVHFVVCDRRGDWVIADFQNDHHPDFGQIAPKNAADCDRLVMKRLEGYLK